MMQSEITWASEDEVREEFHSRTFLPTVDQSEMDRITRLIREQGEFGGIVEKSKYRASGPTRTMVHVLARANGMKARTSVEEITPRKFILWYQLIGR